MPQRKRLWLIRRGKILLICGMSIRVHSSKAALRSLAATSNRPKPTLPQQPWLLKGGCALLLRFQSIIGDSD